MQPGALIVGAGAGISASFARLLERDGYAIALASRGKARRADGVPATLRLESDAADPGSVAAMFTRLDAELPALEVVLYNPSYRVRGPLVELAAEDVRRSLEVTAFGAFLVGQQA